VVVYFAEVMSRDVVRDQAIWEILHNRVIDIIGYVDDFLFDVIGRIFRIIPMTNKSIATEFTTEPITKKLRKANH
jgi:hypothetical protein